MEPSTARRFQHALDHECLVPTEFVIMHCFELCSRGASSAMSALGPFGSLRGWARIFSC
jgi:hypothetical protein